jgi:hypothetical protein
VNTNSSSSTCFAVGYGSRGPPGMAEDRTPPPSVDVDGEVNYQVSSLEDSWVYQNQLQYSIRWTSYDSLPWELAKFVDGLQAVDEFHQRDPRKPGPSENALGGPRC